jgi:hypothetical protein
MQARTDLHADQFHKRQNDCRSRGAAQVLSAKDYRLEVCFSGGPAGATAARILVGDNART